ncbi:MAG: PAS domain S-box protein [Desulfobacteraceae bacterium]|jgi:PAS domain S-box-containing protein
MGEKEANDLLQQAQEKAAKMPEDQEPMSPEETRQMLHELRVHQIELEMQNEELRRAQIELDASRERYFNLYDLAPVGYCTISEKGLILETNLTAAKLMGVARDALVKQPFSLFIHKEDQDIYYLHRKQLFETGEPKGCELRILRQDGPAFWARLEGAVVQHSDGTLLYRVVMSDITDSKLAEAALRESEANIRETQKIARVGRWNLNLSTGLLLWSDGIFALFEVSRETFAASYEAFLDFVHPEDRALVDRTYNKSVENKELYEIEHRLLMKDGRIKWVSEICRTEYDDAGNPACSVGIVQDITERKRIEEALRETQAILKAAMDNNQAGIAIADAPSGALRYVNDAGLLIRGGDRQSIVNGIGIDQYVASWQLMDFDGRPLKSDEVPLARAIMFGETCSREFIIRRTTDDDRIVLAKASPIIDDNGKIVAGVVAFIDITERKQAEDKLRESELRFRTMANAMPQLAWIARADGHIFWYNQRWYDYTGMTPEQLEGWGWQCVHDPSELPKVLERWQASIATGEIFDMTFPLRGADGVFRPFLTRIIPMKDSAGRVLQWFGTNTDVSELKRIEQALRESEALYRSIGESIDYGVWICTPDGRNTYASESFLNMVGITQEQCSDFGWGDLLHPDDAERTIAAWKECVRTGGTWDIEHRFQGMDGQWHHVLARGVPVKNEQGEIISWAGINLDISQLKHAEENLKASLAEKEVLLKEVHHRVKNNLQVISSLISLQADSHADEQLQGVLSDVRNRVQAMGLVHEKLYQADDLARLDFAEYADSLLQNLWCAHDTAAEKVRLSLSMAPLMTPVDLSVHCGLILNELVSNAFKHAFPGGREGEISVTLAHDPTTGTVCLQVRDNGVGLPADLARRQSSSLGLRLVQMLAGQMRGSVRTGPGPGTEFQVNFKV